MGLVRADDFDGTVEGVKEVPFSVDGQNYTVDLSPQNREEFLALFEPYVERARRLGDGSRVPAPATAGARAPRSAAQEAANRARNTAIREWAREQGIHLNPQGRIPKTVLQQFKDAGSPGLAA